MSKSLKKLIDINRLREFKNKLIGTGSAYVQTGAVDQTVAGIKAFSEPIVGSVTGSSGSCTGNAATATKAVSADSATNASHATSADTATNATNATNAGYTNWLRTSSHTDHLFHTEWDGSYFWTYVTAGDGGYRAVRVARSNSSGYADSAGNGVPAGVIIPFAGTSVPTGYLLCNGAAVSRTNYANLFAAIGTLYGAGNGSTTFNLPDARDRVLQGASGGHSAGSYIAAGLPNITGSMQPMYWNGASSTGAMNGWKDVGNVTGTVGDAMGQADVTFNASRSSSYYGASTKPQVDAIATNFIIKY